MALALAVFELLNKGRFRAGDGSSCPLRFAGGDLVSFEIF
jgi:hypothetical protein